MSDIHIERSHALGLERARQVARLWLERAERDYGMACRYTESEEGEEGVACDVAQFERAGLDGSVQVRADAFKLQLTLGFLMAAFQGLIEEKLTRHLDELLAEAALMPPQPARP